MSCDNKVSMYAVNQSAPHMVVKNLESMTKALMIFPSNFSCPSMKMETLLITFLYYYYQSLQSSP